MNSYENIKINSKKEVNELPETLPFYIERTTENYNKLSQKLQGLIRDLERPPDIEKTVRDEKSYKDMLIRNIRDLIGERSLISDMEKCLGDLETKISGTTGSGADMKKEEPEDEQDEPQKPLSFYANEAEKASRELIRKLDELIRDLQRPPDIEKTVKEEKSYKDFLVRNIGRINGDGSSLSTMKNILEALEKKITGAK
ncbi:MAG: hypothetical protein WC788_05450 [Candidatus Paceibacterota bacterium]|jgi:hypothetical protein